MACFGELGDFIAFSGHGIASLASKPQLTAIALWALIAFALTWPGVAIYSAIQTARAGSDPHCRAAAVGGRNSWLWNSKPEVWFVSYIHAAVWVFCAMATLKLWKLKHPFALATLGTITAFAPVFCFLNIEQVSDSRLTELALEHLFRFHCLY